MSIDPSALAPYRDVMGDEADAFVADLIDSFLVSSSEMVTTLDVALAQGDIATFTRSAHTLKSNSAIFGAYTLSGFCQELELAGKDGTLTGVPAKLDELKVEYQQVRQELAVLRRSLPA